MKILKTNMCSLFFLIAALPREILMYIFRWVVSSDLDMRALEQLSLVCRGFYICARSALLSAQRCSTIDMLSIHDLISCNLWITVSFLCLSRDPEIWHSACVRVWGRNCTKFVPFKSWRDMFLQRPRVRFDGNVVIDYKTSTFIIYLSIHIKLSNCHFSRHYVAKETHRQTLKWQDHFRPLISRAEWFLMSVAWSKTLQNIWFFFKSKMAVTLNSNFLCSYYIPRRLHQQDNVHAPRREITGWLLQGLAPSWVLQVIVWLSFVWFVWFLSCICYSWCSSHRYLRFFPDGQVIMLTTPEDPLAVVHRLRTKNTRYNCILSWKVNIVTCYNVHLSTQGSGFQFNWCGFGGLNWFILCISAGNRNEQEYQVLFPAVW